MSKFFITNNSVWYNKLKENIQLSPFKISGEFVIDGVYGIVTKKLQVDNENIMVDRNNVVIQTGTCVYKEEHGIIAMQTALQDFDGNVQEHREDYIGNFGCFIKNDRKMVVFNEATGFYDVFYAQIGKAWIVGTTILDIAKVLHNEITLNKLNVLEELTRFAIFDNDTYFNEIKRLSGDQYLDLTIEAISVKKLDLKIKKEAPKDYKSRIENISREMKYIAQVMYKNFGQTTLGCTGGFDSRMTLAAYLSAGIKPRISYGYGNSFVAESKMGDVEVVKEYAVRYGLDYYIANWNETSPIDKLWVKNIEDYGRLIYDGNEDAYRYYTNPDEKFLSFGYIAEIYREPDWSRKIAEGKMTLVDYLWKSHADIFNSNLIEKSPELVNQWLSKWKKLMAEHGVNDDHFKKEDLFWLILEYRHSADNHMVNLINQYKYAHYLMSDIRIVRNGFVDFENKYNGKFMIQILNKVYPDILNVPFFTHCHKMVYDKAKMMVDETSEWKKRQFIMKLFPRRLKRLIKSKIKHHSTPSPFFKEIETLMKRDGNEQKMRNLIGDKVLEAVDIYKNQLFIIRGLILCKTLEYIGVKY